MNVNYVIVSEDQRRRNSRAKQRKIVWQNRYAKLSLAIRNTKSQLWGRNNIEFVNVNRVQLDALRREAARMMTERSIISHELRDTSYAYAPKELISK